MTTNLKFIKLLPNNYTKKPLANTKIFFRAFSDVPNPPKPSVKLSKPHNETHIDNIKIDKGFEIVSRFKHLKDIYEIKETASEAISVFKEALNTATKEQKAHINYGLGLCYNKLGDWEECEQTIKSALELDPDHVPSYELLGEALQMQEKYKEALVWYTQYFEHFPKFYGSKSDAQKYSSYSDDILSNLLIKRGVCYFKFGDFDKAKEDFNAVIKIDTKNVTTAYNWLGKIAMANAKWWDAVDYNTKAIERNPKSISAHNDRFIAYDALNRKEEAEHDRRMTNLLQREMTWKKM